MKFEIFKSPKSGEYYFNLKAKNGQVILSSEGYSQKSGAKNGIESVKKNCGNDNAFEKKVAKNGKLYFTLSSTNGQEIGRSQMYASRSGMNNGIQSVKRTAPHAVIVEREG